MSFVFGMYVQRYGDTFVCWLCNRTFFGLDAILTHCQTTQRHAWCPRCQLVFRNVFELAEHMAHTVFVCRLCTISPWLSCQGEVCRHMEYVHFVCQLCGFRAQCDEELENHFFEVHFGCPICRRPFVTAQSRASHMHSHNERVEGCPCCPAIFVRFSHVLTHLERSFCSSERRLLRVTEEFDVSRQICNHECDDLRYHCQHCRRKFNTLSALFAHVEISRYCNHLLLSPIGILASLKRYILDWL